MWKTLVVKSENPDSFVCCFQADTFPVWMRVKEIYRQKLKQALAGTFVRKHRTSTAREEMEDSSSSSSDSESSHADQ